MADFLEERLDHQKILMGASFAEQYAVNIVRTSGGQEYRSLVNPFPARTFDISQLLEKSETYNYIMALYHRAHGQYAGFRIRCYDEFSSNGNIGTPTAFDQPLLVVTDGSVYQMIKRYGTNGTAGSTGYPYRVIHKPVSGSVKVGIGTTQIRTDDWSVVTTTGRITFASNNGHAITGISKASSAIVTLGAHTYVTGMSVGFKDVAGMTQINGLRGLITSYNATSITVSINTSAFSVYTSGGNTNTAPQTGESVTCGFEFDWPVRFNGSMVVGQDYPTHRNVDGIELIEILNP
jgi:uncharacterized protein (TIGR02217 family)